jgi:hypothetical protein
VSGGNLRHNVRSGKMNITELETTVAAQARRISILESQVGALMASAGNSKAVERRVLSVEDDRVVISNPPDRITFAMPTASEQKKLLAIVYVRFPKLKPDFSQASFPERDEAQFLEEFSNAFLRIGNQPRASGINKKISLSYWLSECGNWLLQHSRPSEVRGNAYLAAVLAHGDIDFVPADPAMGWVWELGLSQHSGRRANGESWRQVLASGRIKNPTAGSHSHSTPDVRVEFAG